MSNYQRHENRAYNELRNIKLEVDIANYASGSVLVSYGNTSVICAASIENKIPGWMHQKKASGGWITAEYSMLPYSTVDRNIRSRTRGKIDGRTIEIQRLIGRALRAVADLEKMPGYTLWLDCDVLQADGGTRTASITGGYVAARLAVARYLQEGKLKHNPFRDSVSAVSVGLLNGLEILDLDYSEDYNAQVDFNVIMTGLGGFVEIQGAGEGTVFTELQLQKLLHLAKSGINTLSTIQQQTISQEILKLSSKKKL